MDSYLHYVYWVSSPPLPGPTAIHDRRRRCDAKRKFSLQIGNEFDILPRADYPALRQNTSGFEITYGLLDNIEIGFSSPLLGISSSHVVTQRTFSESATARSMSNTTSTKRGRDPDFPPWPFPRTFSFPPVILTVPLARASPTTSSTAFCKNHLAQRQPSDSMGEFSLQVVSNLESWGLACADAFYRGRLAGQAVYEEA